ncbi:HEPN domain-containing protein [uncultured Thiodictyon sp.]|uniref:HEPN domain-containing protein n=1 Tax=uncultured Thiodictyon sp. TaxID=1846217 RepID=UPI0025D45C8F|nr:HEPN domain-containing protein [uncultured Thiodictyon sp.]
MTKEGSQLLDKASRAIRAATRLLADDDTDFAASRAYYAMLYCVQALLTEKGLRFSKHSGAIGAFGAHFAKTGDLDPRYHRWLLDAFDKRQIGDYGIDAVLTQDEVREMIQRADILLAEVTKYLTTRDAS